MAAPREDPPIALLRHPCCWGASAYAPRGKYVHPLELPRELLLLELELVCEGGGGEGFGA